MKETNKIMFVILLITIVASFAVCEFTNAATTEVILPLGTTVNYGLHNSETSLQCSLRYSHQSPSADNSTLYLGIVSMSGSDDLVDLPVNSGATYSDFGFQIRILEVHPDYLLVSINQPNTLLH